MNILHAWQAITKGIKLMATPGKMLFERNRTDGEGEEGRKGPGRGQEGF